MILEEIVADKKRRLPEHMARISESQMRRMAEEIKTREANCFYNHLKKPGLSIIGEFKKASPSLGTITSKIDLMERIAEYNASVDAISRKCRIFKGNPGEITASDFTERFYDL